MTVLPDSSWPLVSNLLMKPWVTFCFPGSCVFCLWCLYLPCHSLDNSSSESVSTHALSPSARSLESSFAPLWKGSAFLPGHSHAFRSLWSFLSADSGILKALYTVSEKKKKKKLKNLVGMGEWGQGPLPFCQSNRSLSTVSA